MAYKDKQREREYGTAWSAKRRAAWMAGKVCAHCGTKEKLVVDHIDPATKVTHKVWNWREDRRLAELAKCQVLCTKCHARKHAGPIRHGTRAAYRKQGWGCRCDLCMADMRECKRRWAKTKREKSKGQKP